MQAYVEQREFVSDFDSMEYSNTFAQTDTSVSDFAHEAALSKFYFGIEAKY